MHTHEHRTYQPAAIPVGARLAPPSPDAFHDAWVDAATEARVAYLAWQQAGSGQRRCAYAVYVAAEDREEAAALAFARAAAG